MELKDQIEFFRMQCEAVAFSNKTWSIAALITGAVLTAAGGVVGTGTTFMSTPAISPW